MLFNQKPFLATSTPPSFSYTDLCCFTLYPYSTPHSISTVNTPVSFASLHPLPPSNPALCSPFPLAFSYTALRCFFPPPFPTQPHSLLLHLSHLTPSFLWCTIGQIRKKQTNSYLINHCPTSEGVSEVSERCERTSERTIEWPSTSVCILGCSRP